MLLIILLLILALIISYPIIGFKIFKAIRSENKRKSYRLSALLLILILVPGFLLRILPGSDLLWKPIDNLQERNDNIEITGHKFNYGKEIFKYESERDFNGDGYSIWIYEIDENTANYFKDPNEDFFTKHPNRKYRKHWESEFWKRTPFNPKEQHFLEFANNTLDNLEFELKDVLNEQGNYYAYQYYMHDFSDGTLYVGNIDFFVICPKRKIIVKINHNT